MDLGNRVLTKARVHHKSDNAELPSLLRKRGHNHAEPENRRKEPHHQFLQEAHANSKNKSSTQEAPKTYQTLENRKTSLGFICSGCDDVRPTTPLSSRPNNCVAGGDALRGSNRQDLPYHLLRYATTAAYCFAHLLLRLRWRGHRRWRGECLRSMCSWSALHEPRCPR